MKSGVSSLGVLGMLPPDFWQKSYPISTGGKEDYAHQIIRAPPDFQTPYGPVTIVAQQSDKIFLKFEQYCKSSMLMATPPFNGFLSHVRWILMR